MISDHYPHNRLQRVLAWRRSELIYYGIYLISAVCAAMLFTPHSYAAGVETCADFDELVDENTAWILWRSGDAVVGSQPTENTCMLYTIPIGNISGTAGYVRAGASTADLGYNFWERGGSDGGDNISNANAVCYYYNGSAWVNQGSDCSTNSTRQIDKSQDPTSVELWRSNYFDLRTKTTSQTWQGSWTSLTTDQLLYIAGDYAQIFLTTTTDPIFPNTAISLRVRWMNDFLYPNQVRYAYYFPNGRQSAHACFFPECEGQNEFGETLVNGTTQPDGLTGSGAIDFTYRYRSVGTYTGTVILSSDCTVEEINVDDDELCDSRKVDIVLTVEDFSLNEATDPVIANIDWEAGNGGGNSGAYLASNKKSYNIGEPVRLRWHYNMTPLVTSSVRLYDDQGGTLIATLTGTGNIAEAVDHYATIYYGTGGVFQPFIRVCVGDCSSIWRDIYLGGGSSPDISKSITIYDSPTGNDFNTDAGAFGLDANTFEITFGNSDNPLIVFANAAATYAGKAGLYIASYIFSILRQLPVFSMVFNIFNPPDGACYTFPDTLFSVEMPTDVLPDVSFCIEYNDDNPLMGAFIHIMVIMVILKIFLNHFFP